MRFVLFFLAFALAHASPVLAQGRSVDARIDQRAAEMALKSARFLAAQPTMSFSWFISFDDVVEGRQKLTYVRSGTTVIDRKQGFMARTEREGALRDYFYDGAVFTVASPSQKFYASMPFSGGFDALVKELRERTGAILPLWSIMSENLPNGLLDDVLTADYLGVTLIAGREAHHLAFTEKDEDWQVWVSTDENAPLPLMLVGTEKTKFGWPQYRAYLSDWDLAPVIEAGQFKFSPGAEHVRVSLPGLSEPARANGGARK